MAHSKRTLLISVFLFLTAEAVLYFLIFNPISAHGTLLRITAILLACLFCAQFMERSWEYATTQIAFIMSITGDMLLALPASPIQLPGVLCFTASHLAYAAQLYMSVSRPAYRRARATVRLILPFAVMALTPLVLGSRCDVLSLICAFYFTHLVLNFCYACIQREHWFMAAGFLLFIISDTILGLSFIEPYVETAENAITDFVVHSNVDFIWAFYLPAQTLLSLSLLPKRWKSLSAKG